VSLTTANGSETITDVTLPPGINGVLSTETPLHPGPQHLVLRDP
jgi:hypothetical protein